MDTVNEDVKVITGAPREGLTYPGFNPDPSIVRDGNDYYIVNSSFEFLPGLPIYHSTDLDNWELIGHVVERSSQLRIDEVPTNGGLWAPVIRKHDDKFYVAVKNAAMGRPGSRGMLIFTATNPAGPWSEGVDVPGVEGIDPDLVWDTNGDCYMAFSGLDFSSGKPEHHGIQIVKLNPDTGKLLGEVQDLWHGSGLMFPEGPHLFSKDGYWYLIAAEGGTDRGHAATVGRSRNLLGPYESSPTNPLITASGLFSNVQNVGHADLVENSDGTWALVCLGVRTNGLSNGFAPLGRETFMTSLYWRDGWPHANLFTAGARAQSDFVDDFSSPQLNKRWVGIRDYPCEIFELTKQGLKLNNSVHGMFDLAPGALTKRLELLAGRLVTVLNTTGTAGMSIRYNEQFHYDIELQSKQLVARFAVNSVTKEISVPKSDNFASIYIEIKNRPFGFSIAAVAPDIIELGWIDNDGRPHSIAEFDGRFLSQEVNSSFTGRMVSIYSVTGETFVTHYEENVGRAIESNMENNFSEAL